MLYRMTALTETQWDTVSFASLLSCDTSGFLYEKTQVLKKTLIHIFLSSRPRSHLFTWGYSQLILLLIKLPGSFLLADLSVILLQKRRWLTFVNHTGEMSTSYLHSDPEKIQMKTTCLLLPQTRLIEKCFLFRGWIFRGQFDVPGTHFG